MDYDKLMELRNEQNPFSKHVGIRITRIEEGYAEVVLRVAGEHLNPMGYVHGGCLYTLADIAAGSAGSSYGKHVVTVSGSVNYLRPVKGVSEIRAVARACQHGKSIAVFDVEILAEDAKPFVKGLFTLFTLDKEIDL